VTTFRSRGSAVIALLLLAGAMTLFWLHRIHLDRPGETNSMINADLLSFTWPNLVFLHNELQAGRLPTWNPYQFAGEPILANHLAGVLYPPNLLAAWLFSPARALDILSIFHFTVSAFFSWLLCRRLGLGTAAAATAAVMYPLSTPMLTGVYQVSFLFTQAWLPAILWSLHGLLEQPRPRWSIALALFVALAFAGGHTQGLLYMLQFAGLYAAFGIWRLTAARSRLVVAGWLAVAAVLSIGFAAPQLLPTALHHANEAARGLDGLTLAEASRNSVPWNRMLWSMLGAPFASHGSFRFIWPILGLPLLVAGVAHSRLRDHALFLAASAILLGLFMIGREGPVFPIYYRLPLGDVFRIPPRIAFVYLLVVTMLVAMGIDSIEAIVKRGGRVRLAHGLAIAAAFTVCLDVYLRTGQSYYHPSIRSSPAAHSWTGGSPLDPLRSLARASGDYGRTFLDFDVSFEKQPKAGMMSSVFVVPDYEPAIPDAYRAYFRPLMPLWHGSLSVSRNDTEREPAQLKRLLDLMAVDRYSTPSPDRFRKLRRFAGGRIESRSDRAIVVSAPTALPRSYTVTCVRTAADRETAIDLLLAADFDPHRQASVTAEASNSLAPLLAGCSDSDPEALREAPISYYTNDEIAIDAHCSGPCLLVLSDLYYPGWRVEVDGREQPLYAANGIFRGAALASGDHRVRFVFAPLSIRIGAGLFGVAVLASLGIAYRDRHDHAA